VAVDDYSRVAYLEVHPDEQAQTVVGFAGRALAYFAGLGVSVERLMTDNGSGYRSRVFGQVLAAAGVTHTRTRPYRPATNGKAERLNLTLEREWAYASAYTSNQAGLVAGVQPGIGPLDGQGEVEAFGLAVELLCPRCRAGCCDGERLRAVKAADHRGGRAPYVSAGV
jgi:transposase InsO family protein